MILALDLELGLAEIENENNYIFKLAEDKLKDTVKTVKRVYQDIIESKYFS